MTATDNNAIADLLTRLGTRIRWPKPSDDIGLLEDAKETLSAVAVKANGLERGIALYRGMLQAAAPFVGDPAFDTPLHTRLMQVLDQPTETTPLLAPDWQDTLLATIKRLGACTPEVLAQAIADDLRLAAVTIPVPAKPFPAPGSWFPTDILGNPMREFAPGKWESWARRHPVQMDPPLTSE